MFVLISIICVLQLQVHIGYSALIRIWDEKNAHHDIFVNGSIINNNVVPENTVGLYVDKYSYDDIQVTEISNLPNLKNIWMYTIGQNVMVKFENLSNLYEIDLSKNELTNVEASMFRKTEIKNVWLYNNEISTIENKSFGSSVTTVSLYCNLLTTFDVEWFEDPSKITWLELHGNKIRHIKENAFKAFANLKDINLVFNEIHTIGDGAFGGNIYNEIYLAYNNLKDLSPKIFPPGRVRIENFDIRYNLLTYLPFELLNKTTIGNINLINGNPWSCACYLNDIMKWVNSNGKEKNHLKNRDGEIQCVSLHVKNHNKCIERVNQEMIDIFLKNSLPPSNTREQYCPCRKERKSWTECYHIQ